MIAGFQPPPPSPATSPVGSGGVSPVEQLTKTFTSLYVGLLEGIPRLIVAIVVVAVFYVLGRLTRRILRPRLTRLRSESFAGVVSNLVYVGIVIFGLLVALPIAFKINAGALLGGVSILALAAGFAFQDIASNLMAGLLLVIREPFRIGDQIEVNSHRGTVRAINFRETRIMTFDGHLILIPNKDVYTDAIDIQTAEDHVRSDITVGVGYDTDLSQARALALEVLAGVDGVLDDPAAQAYFVEFGSSAMDLELRYWTGSQQAEVRRVQDLVVEAVYDAFNAAGIDLPFQVMTLDASEGLEQALLNAASRASDGSGRPQHRADEGCDPAAQPARDGADRAEEPVSERSDRPDVHVNHASERPEVRVSDGSDRGEGQPGDGTGRRLDNLTREELYQRATQLGIRGRSRMSRAQLRQAIEEAG